MYRKRFVDMKCSIARALEEVGEWWSLLIVRSCTEGRTRFDEFQKELGIARNVLTDRLARLVELGILERFPLPDRLNTDGYRLTQKGEELYPTIVSLMQWGDKWICQAENQRVALVDATTGEPVEKITVHSADGRPLSFRDVRFVEGPGATSTTREVIDERNRRVLGEEST